LLLEQQTLLESTLLAFLPCSLFHNFLDAPGLSVLGVVLRLHSSSMGEENAFSINEGGWQLVSPASFVSTSLLHVWTVGRSAWAGAPLLEQGSRQAWAAEGGTGQQSATKEDDGNLIYPARQSRFDIYIAMKQFIKLQYR
jgi:hypothetical protein